MPVSPAKACGGESPHDPSLPHVYGGEASANFGRVEANERTYDGLRKAGMPEE